MNHFDGTDSGDLVSKANSTSLSVASRSANFEKRLAAYAAAGIAGASLLAVTPDAEAKVIYTPAHVVIGQGMTYELDMNNDGSPEFAIFNLGTEFFQELGIGPHSHLQGVINAGVCPNSDFLAAAPAALAAGVEVGRQRKFQPYGSCMRDNFSSDVEGHWQSVTNRYLGLAFLVNGEIHYGWARLNTAGGRFFHAVLTGYAYESKAYASIVTGDEGQGPQAAPGVAPPNETIKAGTTLGELALGAVRREK
jgi:hypothetical protein